jgi:hypothetical protein
MLLTPPPSTNRQQDIKDAKPNGELKFKKINIFNFGYSIPAFKAPIHIGINAMAVNSQCMQPYIPLRHSELFIPTGVQEQRIE